MKREKTQKDDVKLEENKSRGKRASKKKLEPVMDFDAYFRRLMAERPHVRLHHKAPMRQYAEANNLLEGTLEQFEKVFKSY